MASPGRCWYWYVVCLFTVASPIVTTINGVDLDDIQRQIDAVKPNVTLIVNYVMNGSGIHETYDRLALLGDKYGHRVTGSQVLEDAIDDIVSNLTAEGFTNVHKESVTVPVWVRGSEYAKMVLPDRNHSMPMLGLGSSVGTNGAELVAEVYVVDSFEELNNTANSLIAGKIVVYNEPWMGNYGDTNVYRTNGATWASAKGAVAALVRSVTPYSLVTPHCGQQRYGEGVTKIPVAAITIEDAMMLRRLHDRNEPVKVALYMEAENYNDSVSYNVVAEIRGTEFPDEVVIVGGHIDSWDVGTGSMDDGGGVMISWQVLSILQKLNLKPRRTLRLVLWTAEEQGLIGGEEYFRAHNTTVEVGNVSLIMESDHGTFKPSGIGFSGSGAAQAIMERVMNLLSDYGTTDVVYGAGGSSDTGDWVAAGVPAAELEADRTTYFYYHHTHADTMTVLDAGDLDLCTIVWATASYVVASLDETLPRTGEYPPTTPPPATATPQPTAADGACRDAAAASLVAPVAAAILFVGVGRRLY